MKKYNVKQITIFCSLVAFAIQGAMTWYEINDANKVLNGTLKTFLKRNLVEGISSKEDEINPRPYSYILYERYCLERTEEGVEMALFFSGRHYFILHYERDFSNSVHRFKFVSQGVYEKRPFSLALSSSGGETAQIIDFKFIRWSERDSQYLDYFGRQLHPRFCSNFGLNFENELKKLKGDYPKDGEPPAIWNQ